MRIRTDILKTTSYLVLLMLTLFFVSTLSTSALPYGSGTYGSCTYDPCTITLSTSGTVALDLHPESGGVYTIVKDDINVKSGASTGYILNLESSTASTSLVGGANTILATSGTFSSPASLNLNSWGYRLDDIGSFGSGPTSSVTNTSSSSLSFASIKANGSPDTLVATSAASTPTVGDDYDVWYGVRADLTPPAGTYSRTVTYTATQNP